MGINTVPQPPNSPDFAPYDFCLFSKPKEKLRGCRRYETIEEMKEAVTKVIDTLTQEDLHGTFQKLMERYNKCIAAGGDYFEGDLSFMRELSIKVPIRKKSGNLFNDPRTDAQLFALPHVLYFYSKAGQASRLKAWLLLHLGQLFDIVEGVGVLMVCILVLSTLLLLFTIALSCLM